MILKVLTWSLVILPPIPITIFLFFWLKYRIPAGPTITASSEVRYQMIDLGQNESGSRSTVELLSGNHRLFLAESAIPFVYTSKSHAQACWPEPPFDMARKGHTVRITFRLRKLLFASGYTPVKDIQIQIVPGTPWISK